MDLFIDTSQVQLLVSDFYESYTFKIYREHETSEILENYIVTFYNDDTYVQNIINYPWDAINEKWDVSNATAIIIDDLDLLSRNFNDCGEM
jgi:hypothetical protein